MQGNQFKQKTIIYISRTLYRFTIHHL